MMTQNIGAIEIRFYKDNELEQLSMKSNNKKAKTISRLINWSKVSGNK